MLTPVFENTFKKDIKRLQKRGKNIEKLKVVIDQLLTNQPLENSAFLSSLFIILGSPKLLIITIF